MTRNSPKRRTPTNRKYGRHGGSSAASYSGSGKGYGSSYGTSSKMTSRTCKTMSKACGIARGYSNINVDLENRYRSYRTLWDQTRGSCRGNRPTPATLKSFANWINKGANVWKVTNAQINKWCKTDHNIKNIKTCASAKAALCHKFGKTTIKAVTWHKNGGYMVATAPTMKGKAFNWPK